MPMGRSPGVAVAACLMLLGCLLLAGGAHAARQGRHLLRTSPVSGDLLAAGDVGSPTVDTAAADDVNNATIPPYQYLGCFNDPNLYSWTGARRMRRRLAIIPQSAMTVGECAKRARMFGYTLFALSAFEDVPTYNMTTCWGAGEWGNGTQDLTYAKGGGANATACNRGCPTAPGSPDTACGGSWAISLYLLTNFTAAKLIGGSFLTLDTLPIQPVHLMQMTGREEYMFVDYFNAAPPNSAYDYTYEGAYWNRDTGVFTKVPPVNGDMHSIACSIWMRQADGEVVGFSGQSTWSWGNTTWWENYRGLWVMYKYEKVVEQLPKLPYGRWYASAYLNPEGRVVVTGGGDIKLRAEGSDVYDSATMYLVGQTPGVENRQGFLPLNAALMAGVDQGFYKGAASYYPTIQCLPDGSLLYFQNVLAQSLNPVTGAAIAQSAFLPQMVTMYPYSVPIIFGQNPTWFGLGYSWSIDIVVFGGKWAVPKSNAYFPCLDFSARGTFTIDAQGKHSFSAWTTETMPAPRCLSDASLLPNGHIAIVNGGELHAPGITAGYNGGNNYPSNEAWIYSPAAPYGQRYKRTGAYTRVHRAYHAVALLTGRGDVVIAGTSISNAFRSYVRDTMPRTKNGTGQYVLEVFRPHFITSMGPRPAWLSAPASMRYGSSISVSFYAYNVTIKSIVLAENGHSTHSMVSGYRHQVLSAWPVSVNGTGNTAVSTWSIAAPNNTFIASPGFYLMYIVGANDVYSTGQWIQLRGDWNAVPPTLRTTASSVVGNATSTFDTEASVRYQCGANSLIPCLATCDPNAAANPGKGLRVRAQGANDTTLRTVVILSDSFALNAGDRVHTHMWARMSDGGPVFATVTMDLVDADGAAINTTKGPNTAPQLWATMGKAWEYYPLGGLISTDAGQRRVRLSFSGCQFNTGVDLDDVVTTVIAAGAKALPPYSSGAPDPGTAAVAAADDAPIPADYLKDFGNPRSTPKTLDLGPRNYPYPSWVPMVDPMKLMTGDSAA